MQADHSNATPCIGIIANPVSARDIRRIVAYAGNLQISDRVNIVLSVLTVVGAMGVRRVLMMPDNGGIRAMLMRSLKREGNLHHAFPEVEFLDMDPTSTVDDTFLAARMMHAAGVKAIIVLGGDGTHRAVVRECADTPIAGLSTGTNNAFPEMRAPTVTAMAVGLYATGKLSAEQALAPNKLLEVSINEGQRHDIAIVDAVISTDRYIGARALWKTESLAAIYLAFADPQAIGLSAIGGLLHPLGRREAGGLAVQLGGDPATRRSGAARADCAGHAARGRHRALGAHAGGSALSRGAAGRRGRARRRARDGLQRRRSRAHHAARERIYHRGRSPLHAHRRTRGPVPPFVSHPLEETPPWQARTPSP